MEKSLSRIIGSLLLFLGALLFLFSYFNFSVHWHLFLTSLCLMLLYIIMGSWRKRENICLFLPAILIFFVSLLIFIQTFKPLLHKGTLLIFLGIAFLLTFFIHTRQSEPSNSHFTLWPLYTGTILLVIGITSLIYFTIWAFIFLIVGLILILYSYKK